MRHYLANLISAVSVLALPACSSPSPVTTSPTGSYSPPDRTGRSVPVGDSLNGFVLESGSHGPAANVRVCIWQQTNGDAYGSNCTQTGQDGSYKLVFTSPTVGNCPWVTAQDFEPRQDCITLAYPRTTWSPSIQRIIRIEAGQTIASTVFADDTGGITGDRYCVLCKRIRIVAVRAGRLTVRLTPENAGLRLTFWDDYEPPVDLFPMQAGAELTVLVTPQSPSATRSFELATTFLAD